MLGPADIILHILLFLTLYFQVFLLITYLEWLESRKGTTRDTRHATRLPSVTIIVPAYNEEKTLAQTVNSLLRLNYLQDKLQIFIVDDGSTDHTYQIAKNFEGYGNVRAFTKQNGGKHTALNLGLASAQTELIGCMDADSFVEPDALGQIIAYFSDPSVMAVTPAIRVHEAHTLVQKIQKAEYDMGIFLRKMFGVLDAIHVTPGPFSIFRREVFEQIGGWREAHNTEDMEIAVRMHQNEMRIENAPNAYVYTLAPDTLSGLFKQRLRWVHGFLRNAIDYRHLFFKKRFGHIAFLTLPFATLSVFTAIYFFGNSIFRILVYLSDKFLKWQTVGFDLHVSQLDWFFINSRSSLMLVIILIILAVIILSLGQKMAEGRARFTGDAFYFLVFYGLLAPIWFAKAVYNVALFKKTVWR